MKHFILSFIALVFPLLPMSAQDSMGKAMALYNKAERTSIARDYDIAIAALQQASDEGFGQAAYILGKLYMYGYQTTGDFVKADNSKAIQMFEKALELGFDSGHLELGRYYMYGWGTDVNPEKAVYHFKADNSTEGAYYLAYCYWAGFGVEKNVMKAFEEVRVNYDEMGKFYDPLVKFMVASFLENASYHDEFYNRHYAGDAQAERGYTISRIHNYLAACCIWSRINSPFFVLKALRYMYVNEWLSVGADKSNSSVNYQEIAKKALKMKGFTEKESGEILYILAYLREKEVDGQNNYYNRESPVNAEYLTKSAELGYAPAMEKLAKWYETGYTVSKNLVKANQWKEKAEALSDEIEAEVEKFDSCTFLRIYREVDEKATCPTLQEYLDSFEKPTDKDGNPLKGNVVIRFAVDKKGKAKDFRIISSDNPVLTKFATTQIENLPKFNPAKRKDKEVASLHQWNFAY